MSRLRSSATGSAPYSRTHAGVVVEKRRRSRVMADRIRTHHEPPPGGRPPQLPSSTTRPPLITWRGVRTSARVRVVGVDGHVGVAPGPGALCFSGEQTPGPARDNAIWRACIRAPARRAGAPASIFWSPAQLLVAIRPVISSRMSRYEETSRIWVIVESTTRQGSRQQNSSNPRPLQRRHRGVPCTSTGHPASVSSSMSRFTTCVPCSRAAGTRRAVGGDRRADRTSLATSTLTSGCAFTCSITSRAADVHPFPLPHSCGTGGA